MRWAAETFGDRPVPHDVADRRGPGRSRRPGGARHVEVVFLDTQYHFPETLATLETVRAALPGAG